MWEQKSSLEMSKTKTITKTTFLLGFFLGTKHTAESPTVAMILAF